MANKKSENNSKSDANSLDGTKLLVEQTRSMIGRDERVRSTLRALGLGKIGRSVVVIASPSTIGMIDRVKSIVSVNVAQ